MPDRSATLIKRYGSTPEAGAMTPRSVTPRRSLEGGERHDPFVIPDIPHQVYNLLVSSSLNVLLLFLPFALLSPLIGWSDGITFTTNFLSLIPLAAMLGDLTEDIALRSNASIAALINVTFGNATELIISIVALRSGALDVIRYSLIGSVLGNMLLVLGCSFLANGLRFELTNFNVQAVNVYGSVLMLTSMSFVIPSAFEVATQGKGNLLALSHEIAVVSCLMYVTYLGFQLITHKSVFDDNEEEEEDSPQYSFGVAVAAVGVVAFLISIGSDFLVGSIEGTAVGWNLSRHFIGVILVPIVGNASEHVTAVTQAFKGNIDISFGIAVGSSIQISCFVVPFMVLVAWACGIPLMMDFHPFSTSVMFVSVVVLNNLTTTGKCHWLNGVMLLSAYVMLSLAYLHIPDVHQID